MFLPYSVRFFSSATNKFSNFVYDETLCAAAFTRFAPAAVEFLSYSAIEDTEYKYYYGHRYIYIFC